MTSDTIPTTSALAWVSDPRPACTSTQQVGGQTLRCAKREHTVDDHVAIDPPGDRNGKPVFWSRDGQIVWAGTIVPAMKVPDKVVKASAARAAGYTGDSCGECGSPHMVRTGSCATCQQCGKTTGCS